MCACGWLADGTIGYPIHKPRQGCAGTTGIIGRDDKACQTHVDAHAGGKADAYCYKP